MEECLMMVTLDDWYTTHHDIKVIELSKALKLKRLIAENRDDTFISPDQFDEDIDMSRVHVKIFTDNKVIEQFKFVASALFGKARIKSFALIAYLMLHFEEQGFTKDDYGNNGNNVDNVDYEVYKDYYPDIKDQSCTIPTYRGGDDVVYTMPERQVIM